MMYATTLTAPVFGLRREIDRLFENAFGRGQAGRNEWTPAVDIHETDQELTFVVELPGFKLEDIQVTAVDGILTIQGQRIEEQKEGEEGRYHLVERNYGSFMRRFQPAAGRRQREDRGRRRARHAAGAHPEGGASAAEEDPHQGRREPQGLAQVEIAV